MRKRRLPARAGDAVRAVLAGLLDAIRSNEQGAMAGSEPDALHDFRVAVRRTRVALTRAKAVLAPDIVRRFRGELAWLGRVSGPARDLDVCVLALELRGAELEGAEGRDLRALIERLGRDRARAHRQLTSALDSDRYRGLIDGWSEYLGREPDPDEEPEAASRSIEGAAEEWIDRARRRAVKRGRRITSASPPEALHRLRIDCKKLRYLLEFFRPVVAGSSAGAEIRALKRLQDHLGALNDYEVQRSILEGSLAESDGEGGAAAARAVGRLLVELRDAWSAERLRFDGIFARFRARL